MINYNEMFKINENCKTKIEKVENHTVLTIDNFYKYPNKIYEIGNIIREEIINSSVDLKNSELNI